ncbi:uncharacterized protein LOC129911435 [Episyrphus balteatus]|uniref:uncharacterized protein LOC129911435 n=1 Tax=Episyrphus balteatus TaxID=286459 RepID=UPI0024857318|nr:uncharacterized protein LOC129911435 [Episyrphus balteatus]
MSNKSKVKKRRDRNTLTFYEKIAVIRHHEANQLSRNNLARMFQCCTTQIRRIIERKDEILAQWQTMCETDAPAVMEEMSKKRREFEMKAIGFILHQWIERCRDLQLNMVINDATLKMISTKMATVLNIKDFKPTGRWIERFRLKFKYKDANLSNPSSKDDPQGTLSVEDIIIEFKNFLPSFMRQEISNITSNNMEVEECALVPIEQDQQVDKITDEQPNKDNEDDLEKCQNREDNVSPKSSENIAAENVLEHLSVIKQFLQSNSDFEAMTVATHLQNYIEQTYILHSSLPSPLASSSPSSPLTDQEFVILIE